MCSSGLLGSRPPYEERPLPSLFPWDSLCASVSPSVKWNLQRVIDCGDGKGPCSPWLPSPSNSWKQDQLILLLYQANCQSLPPLWGSLMPRPLDLRFSICDDQMTSKA